MTLLRSLLVCFAVIMALPDASFVRYVLVASPLMFAFYLTDDVATKYVDERYVALKTWVYGDRR